MLGGIVSRLVRVNTRDDKSKPYGKYSYAEELPSDIEPCRQLLTDYSGVPADQVDQHIRTMRDKAWAIHPYPCVGLFRFLQLSISRHPLYQTILARLTDGSGATLLDMGCCFAQDLRKLTADGVPSENLYGADLRLEFLDLGYELFRDRGRIKATFYEGDALAPAGSAAERDLAQLDGKMNFVHAASFLHLFNWADQVTAAVRLVKFLRSDAQDAVIFGRQMGATVPGEFPRGASGSGSRYSHNVASFQRLWDEVGAKTGTKWAVKGTLHDVPDWTKRMWDRSGADVTRLLVFEVHKVL